jgi:hypothetical protein
MEDEGGKCPECNTPAVWRVCYVCGKGAWIIDCGHYPQPRPISVDPQGEMICDECNNQYGRGHGN